MLSCKETRYHIAINMNMSKNHKILLTCFSIILLLISTFIVLFLVNDFSKPVKQYQEQIQVHCVIVNIDNTNIDKSSINQIDQTKFYRYDDNREVLIATPYNIDDYVPYQIKVTIVNDSELELLGKHLMGIYSTECVFTEFSDISYWTGNIPPYSTKSYDMFIWFNRSLSTNQIVQYISEINCSYRFLGNFSYFNNTIVEKTIDIPCEFELETEEIRGQS